MAHMNRFGKTIRILAALVIGAGYLLLAADEPKQKAPASKTQRAEFPPGGTLRLARSSGMLTVEAWDRPDVEITTISSSNQVSVKAERQGNELVITTSPRGRPFSVFDPECRIKAPAAARLIADHNIGDVNVDGLTGDIQVTLWRGEIMLHLPEEGRYDIHAKSNFGNVNSDFPGPEKRSWWLLGHRSVNENSEAAHKLNLRVAFGDIVILKTRVPTSPGPLTQAPKAAGL